MKKVPGFQVAITGVRGDPGFLALRTPQQKFEINLSTVTSQELEYAELSQANLHAHPVQKAKRLRVLTQC